MADYFATNCIFLFFSQPTLNQKEKIQFEKDMLRMRLNCGITGIKIEVDETDKLLAASRAVIPVFHSQNWRYTNLFEVLFYPNKFNEYFKTGGKNRRILGMVGTGYLEGIMILPKPALHQGFANESDKKNTEIYKFVHLIENEWSHE